MVRKRDQKFILFIVVFLFCVSLAYAGEQGHYTAQPLGVRDIVLPPKGFYYVQYTPYYHSDKLFDKNGNELTQIQANRTITVKGFPIEVSALVNIDLEVESYGVSPLFLVATDKKFLGAEYGFLIAPYFGSIKARLDAEVAQVAVNGITVPGLTGNQVVVEDTDSGAGDIQVMPLFLGWRGNRYDLSFMYGFYAPTGSYDKNHLANMGMGFWSHFLTAGGMYYLQDNKATGLMFKTTWEYNTKKEDLDVTPGQNVILEYGISQYLSEQLEIGISGFSSFQVTEDSGSDAKNKDVKDRIHGVSAQIGYWLIKEKLNTTLKYVHEYGAEDRFQGDWGSLNLIYIF